MHFFHIFDDITELDLLHFQHHCPWLYLCQERRKDLRLINLFSYSKYLFLSYYLVHKYFSLTLIPPPSLVPKIKLIFIYRLSKEEKNQRIQAISGILL